MGCAPGRPGLGSPELIAVKIRAPSSPFEPFRNVDAPRGTDPGDVGRPAAMSMLSRPAALAALVLVLAACSSSGASSAPPAASGAPSSPPSGAPSASPATVGAIEHKTGPTDVILRYDEGGGFVMPAWTARRHRPSRSTATARSSSATRTQEALPAVGSVMPLHPFRTAKMNEEQIQDAARFALGEGGLGAARPEYLDMMVSDASTAVFTVNAGGLAKTVSVYALGLEVDRTCPISSRARPWRSCATTSSTSTRAARSRPTSTHPSAIARSCSRASPAPRTRRPGRGRTSRPPTS